jgi:hypothetical protein
MIRKIARTLKPHFYKRVRYPIELSIHSDRAGNGETDCSDLVAPSTAAVLKPSPHRRIVLCQLGQGAKMQGTLLARKDRSDQTLPPIL